MNGLFIRLYLDEDVSAVVGAILRARGHDVLTTNDAAHLGASDDQQLTFAMSEGRAIVTHNRVDFERFAQEYVDSAKSQAGIIIAVRRPPGDVARRLLALPDQVAADEMANLTSYV